MTGRLINTCSAYLSFWPDVCLFVCLFVRLFACLFVVLFVCFFNSCYDRSMCGDTALMCAASAISRGVCVSMLADTSVRVTLPGASDVVVRRRE